MTAPEVLLGRLGSRIHDRYELIDLLGHGASGVVYRALDHELGAMQVAIKLLFPHLLSDPAALARFRQEVLVARRLSHPNIIKLYEFGSTSGGIHYLTMEYVAGTSLGALLSELPERRFAVPHAVRLLYELAAGLTHAHENGVIHRDIKPQNILVDRGGHARLCDFGVARVLGETAALTRSGESVGTPTYMAPEQFQGDRVDERADVYAVGIVGFELLTGSVPFADTAYYRLALMHLNDPLPPFPAELHVPAWLQDALRQATAKDPERRYPSAAPLRVLLEGHLDSGSAESCQHLVSDWSAREVERIRLQRRRRMYRFALSLGLIVLGAFIGVLSTTTIVAYSNSRHWWGVATAVLKAERLLGTALVAPFRSLFAVDMIPTRAGLESEVARYLKPTDETDEARKFYRLRTLIDAGVDTNIVVRGIPGLVFFAAQADEKVVAALLENETTDPNVVNARGNAVLHLALLRHSPELLNLVLAHPRTLLNLQNAAGETPLHLAALTRNSRALSLLLKRASIRTDGCRAKNLLGLTPLQIALLDPSPVQGELVRLLIPCSDLDSVDSVGRTAVTHAVLGGSLRSIQALRAHGATFLKPDAFGFLPIHYAIAVGNSEVEKYLFDNGGVPAGLLEGLRANLADWSPEQSAAAQITDASTEHGR